MNISLKPVTKENYEAICDLDVAKHQEDYVACNMWSLVESFFNDGHVTRGIYRDDEAVGFIMWVFERPEKASIYRFMLDEKFQQQGIGRQAFGLALDEIRAVPDTRTIEVCYNPQNPVAGAFYQSFGFIETGMDEDDEDMLAELQVMIESTNS